MTKEKLIMILLTFLFGIGFMTLGLSFYGLINQGLPLLVGLSNPAHWILGFVFGLILALGTWMTQRKVRGSHSR